MKLRSPLMKSWPWSTISEYSFSWTNELIREPTAKSSASFLENQWKKHNWHPLLDLGSRNPVLAPQNQHSVSPPYSSTRGVGDSLYPDSAPPKPALSSLKNQRTATKPGREPTLGPQTPTHMHYARVYVHHN